MLTLIFMRTLTFLLRTGVKAKARVRARVRARARARVRIEDKYNQSSD